MFTTNVNEQSKLKITPVLVEKTFQNSQPNNDISIVSDSNGDVLLLLHDNFTQNVIVHNVKFMSDDQNCEFVFSNPISITSNTNQSIKIANKAEFEHCHPAYKGYSFISTNNNLSFSNRYTNTKGIAAEINWQTNKIVISTFKY